MSYATLEGPDGKPVVAKGDADGALLVAVSGGVTVTGGATEANQDAANTKLDTLLTQTDGLENSATTTATNTGTAATNTTAIAASVDGLEAGQTTGNASLASINSNTDQVETKLDTIATNQAVQATAANQATANASLSTIATQATTTATNTGTTATNTTAISGAVVSSESTWSSLGASVAPTLKSGAGKVWMINVSNVSASTTLYAWVFDALSATGTPILAPIPLAPGAWYAVGNDVLTLDGKSLSTGLTIGFSTSRTTYSAHSTATDCHAWGYGS